MNVGRAFRDAARATRRGIVGSPLSDVQEREWLQNRAARAGKPWPNTSPTAVQAYVNYSRWVADCPDCNAAMWLRAGQAEFVCGNCFTATRPVDWPDEPAEVEQPLLERPDPESRNWRAPETPADLVRQNEERR